MKERLIGAAVLAALGVWLIPWLLDGPDEPLVNDGGTLELPVPSGHVGELRTEIIDLSSRREAGGGSGADAARSVPAPESEQRASSDARAAAVPPSGAVEAPPDAARAAADSSDARNASSVSSAAEADGAPSEARSGTAAASGSADPRAGASSDVRAGTSSGTSSTSAGTAAPPAGAAVSSAPPAAAASPGAGAGSSSTSSASSASAAARASAADAPAARTEANATGGWAVQLGSFGDEANARRLAERVAALGHSPKISTYQAGGRVLYRVRVGPHASRAAAEDAASALAARGLPTQVVTN